MVAEESPFFLCWLSNSPTELFKKHHILRLQITSFLPRAFKTSILMKLSFLTLTSQGNKIKREIMRFCSFQVSSRTHMSLVFKQRMFLVAMPTDAPPAIKKHHSSPLFHELTQSFTLPKVFLYSSLCISLWLQMIQFHRTEYVAGQKKSKTRRFQGKTPFWNISSLPPAFEEHSSLFSFFSSRTVEWLPNTESLMSTLHKHSRQWKSPKPCCTLVMHLKSRKQIQF